MSCILTSRVDEKAFTLAEFTSRLLEEIMVAAGTTSLSARESIQGGYEIRVGRGLVVSGATPAQAYRKLMFWLLTHNTPLMEGLQGEIAKAQVHEEERVAKLIGDLTRGGMSELGKELSEYRNTRGAAVFFALREVLDASPSGKENSRRTLNDLLDEIRGVGNLADIAPEELLVAVSDYLQLKKTMGAG